MVNATYNSVDLGNVQTEEHIRDTGLTVIPGVHVEGQTNENDEKPYTFKFSGVIKRIRIQAIKVDTIANIASFIQTLETWVRSDVGYTYSSDYVTMDNMKVEEVSWTINAGVPNVLEYSITFVQSNTLT